MKEEGVSEQMMPQSSSEAVLETFIGFGGRKCVYFWDSSMQKYVLENNEVHFPYVFLQKCPAEDVRCGILYTQKLGR